MDEILRVKEVEEVTGLSRTTIWRLEKASDSDFPSRRKLGPGATGYLKSEIQEWLESRPKVNGDREE
jgi:prophage regulatory protein